MKLEEITHKLKSGELTSPKQIRETISSLNGVLMIPCLLMSQGNLIYRARLIEDINEIIGKVQMN